MKNINGNAPVTCTMTVSINSSPERVWAVLTDIDKWNTWQLDIRYSKLNGPLAPQTTFDWKSGGVKISSILHTVNRNSQFGWTGRAFGTFAVHNWTLDQQEDRTLVTVEESMEGFLVHLFKKSFNKKLDGGMQRWLNWLRRECES